MDECHPDAPPSKSLTVRVIRVVRGNSIPLSGSRRIANPKSALIRENLRILSER